MTDVDKRVGFIQWIVGESEDGYVGLAARVADTNDWLEEIYEYPKDLAAIGNFIARYELVADLYFCATPLDAGRRVKKNITRSTVMWADLDDCSPDSLNFIPSVIVESSPGRHQAYWKLTETVHADRVELLNKKITLEHIDDGIDKSGFDLSQLLRIPGTKNFKYEDTPTVKVVVADTEKSYSIEEAEEAFAHIDTSAIPDISYEPPPIEAELKDPLDIIGEIQNPNPRIYKLFSEDAPKDRSAALWELLSLLLEADVTKDDAFIVAKHSQCNKFDNDEYLWRDVIRASANVERKRSERTVLIHDDEMLVRADSIMSKEDIKEANEYHTIIDDYTKWATTATDAAPQYHVGVGISILSVLLASSLRLYTQFGEIKPNIWLMIIGDTTTSRKSTSMEMGTDIIDEIFPSALLATDGTVEGLITSIAARPGKVSLFHRDEVSGLLEAMAKKEYNAGMLEAFTKLYDGKRMKRTLRREQIDVNDPVFIMITGGTKEGVFSALNINHIRSGFAPRFCYISADTDLTRVRGLGPKTASSRAERNALVAKFEDIFDAHSTFDSANPFAEVTNKEVTLTDEAWTLYNLYDSRLMDIAQDSNVADRLTPMLSRLAMSGLKMSMLIAASAVTDSNAEITVTDKDIKKAFSYVDEWKRYSLEIVLNAGRSESDRLISDTLSLIVDAGATGIARPRVMQALKLNTRNAQFVFSTLEERGLIFSKQRQKVIYYYPKAVAKQTEKVLV